MSAKTFFDGILNRLKRNQVLFRILFIVLGVLLLVFVFILFKPRGTKSPEEKVSLAQALTLVAEASQTAQAANPGFSASQAAHSSPVATKVATGTASPLPSSVNSTQTTSARSPQVFSSPTKSSATATDQNNSQEASPTFPVSNVTVRPTYTPKPTETIRPEEPPTATFTSKATPGPGLPGLTMSAVIGQLSNEKGFACAQEGSTPGPILWMCDVQIGNDLWYHVDLYGSPEIEVTDLLVAVFQANPDDAKAVDILGFMASLPYDGSDASAARQWVAQILPDITSVDDVREKFIGGVRFRLFGGPQGRYLEMGEPPQQ